jgi:hypothetical protein
MRLIKHEDLPDPEGNTIAYLRSFFCVRPKSPNTAGIESQLRISNDFQSVMTL